MLVGQPVIILGYTVLPLVECQCERKGTLTLVMQYAAQGWLRSTNKCPSCERVFTVHRVTATPDGHLEFAIEMGTTAGPAEVAPGPLN